MKKHTQWSKDHLTCTAPWQRVCRLMIKLLYIFHHPRARFTKRSGVCPLEGWRGACIGGTWVSTQCQVVLCNSHVLLSFWQQFFPPGSVPLDPSMDPLSSMTQMTQFLLCSKSFCWVLPYRCVKVKGERTFDVEKKRNARLPERHNSLSARSRRERHCCSFEAWTCNWQCSALCAHIAAQMPAEPGAKPGKCE